MSTLDDRMKEYEFAFRYKLPQRCFKIIRIDGKAFHTFTKGMNKPYDDSFVVAMNNTSKFLLKNIQGAILTYTQSDEISVLLCDFKNLESQGWFNNTLQKMVSISSSLATAKFNQDIHIHCPTKPLAFFDSRIFILPTIDEVINYFVWRQQDCVRNSLHTVASVYCSHKELMNKGRDQQHELIHQAGDNWANYPEWFKNGRVHNKTDMWSKTITQNRHEFQKLIEDYLKDDNA